MTEKRETWIVIYTTVTVFFVLSLMTVSDDTRITRDVFYFLAVIPSVLLLNKRLFSFFASNIIVILSAVYCVYYILSSLIIGVEHYEGNAYDLFRRSLSIIIFVLLIGYLASREEYILLIGVYILIAFIIVSSFVSLFFFGGDMEVGATRLNGIGRFENPIFTGILYVIAINILISINSSGKWWYIKHIIILFFVFLIFMTLSRSPVLGLITLIGFHLITFHNVLAIKKNIGYMVILLIGLAIISAQYDLMHAFLERGASYRIELWTLGIGAFLENPVFGHGHGNVFEFVASDDRIFDRAHNVFISQLNFGGVLGAGSFVALCAAAVSMAWRQRRRLVGKVALGGWVTFLTTGMFGHSVLIVNVDVQWLFFWLPVGLSAACAEIERTERYRRRRNEALPPAMAGDFHHGRK